MDSADIHFKFFGTMRFNPMKLSASNRKGFSVSVGGLSNSRIGRLRKVMAGYVERGEVPGLVTAVSRRGEAHIDPIGSKALGSKDPIQRDTIFRIASMTKPITAVATMILLEECKLRLDEPVERLLPELSDRKVLKRLEGPLDDTVPADRQITVRDLLSFRLGFGVVFASGTYPIERAMIESRLGQGPPNPSIPPPPNEWMRRLGKLPLMHQPGEQWMYNTGSDVLGVLIARASGKQLEDFFRERIFAPLGMRDTSFSVPSNKLDRLATSYLTDFKTGSLEFYDGAQNSRWATPPAFPSGAGGLVSTIDDYLAFGQMLLNKGKLGFERILSRPSVELMTSDQLTPKQKAASTWVPGYFENHGWGFGVSVVTRRDDLVPAVGSFGWNGGLGTMWYSDPEEEMVTILLTQRAMTSPVPPDFFLDFLTSAYRAIED